MSQPGAVELEHGVQDVLWTNLGQGWVLTCLCGWDSGLCPNVESAGLDFDDHLADTGAAE